MIIETLDKTNSDPMAICGIVVKNHGLFAWGKRPGDAVYHAFVMETVAEMALKTLLLNPNASKDQTPTMDNNGLFWDKRPGFSFARKLETHRAFGVSGV